MSGEKFVELINRGKHNSAELTDLIYGEVKSIAPLKVLIDGRFEIGEKFLLLSRSVKEMVITSGTHIHVVPGGTSGAGGGPGHTHPIPQVNSQPTTPTITLWRGLQVGDKVIMLRVNKGQLYYVMERV